MTAFEFLLLVVAGLAAGTVNAIAGGGTFFTFAALAFSGLPTLDANATSAVALTPANLASVIAYRAEVRIYARDMLPFLLTGAVGAIAGVWLLIAIGDAGFRPTVPWLLLLATVLFAVSGTLRRVVPHVSNSPMAKAAVYAVMTLVAVYGGFFGAGMGIMMLAALVVVDSENFHRTNAIKNVVALLIQVVSASLLIASGLVHWPQGVITTIASVVGGYVGVGLARKVPERIMRAVVVITGTVLTAIFFLRG